MLIQFLEARYGDAILISFSDSKDITRNILIDGGLKKSYRNSIFPHLKEIQSNKQRIDLLIVTHHDQDHISGILKLVKDIEIGYFQDDFIGDFWFNGLYNTSQYLNLPFGKDVYVKTFEVLNKQISAKQGLELEKYFIKEGKLSDKPFFSGNEPKQFCGTQIRILTPKASDLTKLAKHKNVYTEKKNIHLASKKNDYDLSIEELAKMTHLRDKSFSNISSLGILIEYGDYIILLPGDAPTFAFMDSLEKIIIEKKVKRLKVDLFKLPHHGSIRSFNAKILDLIECNHFVISTDGSRYNHPTKETLAKIILHSSRNYDETIHFYFNYDNRKLRSIFKLEEIEQKKQKFNFICHFPKEETCSFDFKS